MGQISCHTIGATKIIGNSVRKYHIDTENVMPFLQYCSKDSSEYWKNSFQKVKGYKNELSQDEKKKILKYRNSLNIINYFEKICGQNKAKPPMKLHMQHSQCCEP